jgi:hypothetical protein
MKTLILISILFLLAGCPDPKAPAAQRDFFECGANNTLVACPVGETPDATTHGDCRAVGDGDTTLDVGTCS